MITKVSVPKRYIVSWSGGKDSTYMLHYLLDNGYPVDEVVCCDTTIEFPEMYDHQRLVVDKILSKYPDVVFTFLKPSRDFDFYFNDYVVKRGPRSGECGLGWCNPNNLWCRKYLKVSVIDNYLDDKYGKDNYITYIGIAYDEYDRYNYDFVSQNKRYILIEKRITELMCLHGCWDLGYDFYKLYDLHFRVSCWCCPLQSIKDLYVLYSYHPELWQRLLEYDSNGRGRFRKDYTLLELQAIFDSKKDLVSSMNIYFGN